MRQSGHSSSNHVAQVARGTEVHDRDARCKEGAKRGEQMSGAAASIGGSSVAAHHLCSPRCSPTTPSLRQPYALLLPVGGRSPTRPESRYTIDTLHLKLEGLGNIRGTFLACAPFLGHAHVKCFHAALLSHPHERGSLPSLFLFTHAMHLVFRELLVIPCHWAWGDLKPGRAATDSSL